MKQKKNTSPDLQISEKMNENGLKKCVIPHETKKKTLYSANPSSVRQLDCCHVQFVSSAWILRAHAPSWTN
jgi:hypothetical protein